MSRLTEKRRRAKALALSGRMAGAQPLAETKTGAQSQPSTETDPQAASPSTSASGAPPHVVQTVQKTFSRLYSALRNRELQTLQQLDASWRLKSSLDLSPEDPPLIVDNESLLIEEINKFGAVDFQKLQIDPEQLPVDKIDDKNCMFSYKSLEDVLNRDSLPGTADRLLCSSCGNVTVHVVGDDSTETSSHTSMSSKDKCKTEEVAVSDIKIASCDSYHKLNPTQDWLNHIIYETETEPSQIVDLLEHSAIECS